MKLEILLQKLQCPQQQVERYAQGEILSSRFYRKTGVLQLELHFPSPLGYEAYHQLKNIFRQQCHARLDMTIYTDNNEISYNEVNRYVAHLLQQEQLLQFRGCTPMVVDNALVFPFFDEIRAERAKEQGEVLEMALAKLGLNYEVVCEVKEISLEQKVVKAEPTIVPQGKPQQPKPFMRPKKLKPSDYPLLDIKDLQEGCEDIAIIGKVLQINETVIRKTNKAIQTIYVYDDEDAISMKRFENKRVTREMLDEVREGCYVKCYGSVRYDEFEREIVFMPEEVEVIDNPKIREDKASQKRVELHSHSNLSEMDGVCSVEELIEQAFAWGHRGFVITDHMDVQAFPDAQACVESLLKKNPDREFKMGYGVEVNMVHDELTIVRNPNDHDISGSEFIVFDLETTGLSCYFDHIIEFGAVRLKDQQILERKQFFVKPPVLIPAFIQEKTNITNQDVADAKTFAEVADELVEWIGDAVLVAHNATFDYSFLNEELRRLNKPALTNPTIDTLDLARSLLPSRKRYNLGAMARQYGVAYDEEVAHRADYDAQVLSDVFLMLLQEVKKQNVTTLNELQRFQTKEVFMKMYKNHCTLIAKNQAGLKTLFKMISVSNTDTLAIMGKANSKSSGEEFLAEPRMLASLIDENRENLLVGSACFNGELFELAANRSDADLMRAMKFYDYIELQPLENYRPLIESHSVPSVERLQQILLRLIKLAKALNLLVCATGDVHYCHPSEKIYRDIYIQTQGIGGTRHPLFIYNKQRRMNTVNPDQHFRTTQEMLDAFSWLQDPDLVEKLVIVNPNKLIDRLEIVKPIHKKLYPPHIEGSDQKLRDICYETAHRIYGENLPEIVSARLERELTSIIGNGYSVIYYVSHLLVKKSNEDGYLVGSRGSVGSSFVATMSGITEVNPLAPHYVCEDCHYTEFITDNSVASGYDLPDKVCPNCGKIIRGNGQDIPFETFLGFEGDKVPDIDLNFSNEYQWQAHNFTKTVFGDDHVFRAGTIGTVADKTAFGYVKGYCEEMGIENMRQAQRVRLSLGCTNVKRTTGQHPGGIIVIPEDMDVYDFTPTQYPANNPESSWKTTHFDFHKIHDNVLKFDILGHVDPTAMRLLQNISGIDPKTIPMNDPATMSIFSSADALKADTRYYHEKTGAAGLPEFGTPFVRGILELTQPQNFSDLIIISGLSHGTDVWLNNAKDLVDSGMKLRDCIGCRDDIMVYLLAHQLEPKDAFTIMETVRKGKAAKQWAKDDHYIQVMKEHNVPDWYIDSCLKIKYMFPKAHAVAYVIMAIRIAWFKVHYPHWYYISYFSLRCDAYEIETMVQGLDAIAARMDEIQRRLNNPETKRDVSKKEKDIYNTLEVCLELYARGYRISNLDLYLSKASEFVVDPNDDHVIIPPFTVLDGLGESVAITIVEEREKGEFLSKEDLMSRTKVSSTMMKKFEKLGMLDGLQEKNQLSLF